MDVDDPLGVAPDEGGAQDAHVLREDQVVELVGREHLLQRRLVRLPRQPLMRHVVKRDPELAGERPQRRVVADDRFDRRAELGVRVPQQQLTEAVVLGRREHGDSVMPRRASRTSRAREAAPAIPRPGPPIGPPSHRRGGP